MYLVCWNHDCRQTYDAKNFKPDDRNVACEKCGGTVISNSGKIELSNVPYVMKTIDPEKHKESEWKTDVEKVELEGGKYTLLHHTKHGGLTVLRHDEPWRNETGDKLILSMFQEIQRLRNGINDALYRFDNEDIFDFHVVKQINNKLIDVYNGEE